MKTGNSLRPVVPKNVTPLGRTVSMTCASRLLECVALPRALGVLELLRKVFSARGELNLLLAQLQEIARASHELLVIDRAVKEVGRADLERAQPEFALLVDGDHDDRDLTAVRQSAQAPDNSAPSIDGILKSVTTRSGVLCSSQARSSTGLPKL